MRIDHIEVLVPRRRPAAAWYEDVFGCRILQQHRGWAEHEQGPLMISPDGGETMLALFRGQPQADEPTRGWQRLAFRVDGPAFAAFVRGDGRPGEPRLTDADVSDHGKALSVYFADPWGNPLEVTTYEVEEARRHLGQASAE